MFLCKNAIILYSGHRSIFRPVIVVCLRCIALEFNESYDVDMRLFSTSSSFFPPSLDVRNLYFSKIILIVALTCHPAVTYMYCSYVPKNS